MYPGEKHVQTTSEPGSLDVAASSPQPTEQFSVPERPGRAMRVLAAEDNPVFQSVLRTMLSKWGYDGIVVRDGQEAWQVLRSPDAPRLAILDWMMPGMDGVEVCRRVRAELREPYIYILLLSGAYGGAGIGGRHGRRRRRLNDHAFQRP